MLPIKRYPRLLTYCQNRVVSNLEMLRKAGVSEAKVKSFLINWPRALSRNPNKFKEAVEKVKKMGVDPEKSTFSEAVSVVIRLSSSTWKTKMSIYKKWGYSEGEVMAVFVTYPNCMSVSGDKIDGIMDFLVNKIGWESPRLVYSARIVSLSLNKRIIPRCAVYQVLLSKGFIKEYLSLYRLLKVPEDKFLKRYVECYEETIPELLNVYQEKMNLSK